MIKNTMKCRLPTGGQINRARQLHFTFNGKPYVGYEGDTLASALLANGVHLLGRSFKYHRPRGVLGLGAEDPNALVQIGTGATTLPNQRATQIRLYDGLIAKTVNGFPQINYDFYAGLGLFAKLLSAGFYYKTFMWPKSAWQWYEEKIRTTAGLGVSPIEQDPDYYEHRNVHVDILIIGGGIAGLSAAVIASASGKRIFLVDEQEQFGGALLSSRQKIEGINAIDWVVKQVNYLKTCDRVTLLPKTTAFGQYDHHLVAMVEHHVENDQNLCRHIQQTLWHVRANKLILATGAIERGLSFGNNDRPGVMLASAVSGYINRYAVKLGYEGVVFTNNDWAYQTAIDMQSAGVNVIAIVDIRLRSGGSLQRAAEAAGIKVYKGYAITNTRGRKRLKSIRIQTLSQDKKSLTGKKIDIRCDLLAISGGFSPTVHLHSHVGGKNIWDPINSCFVPDVKTANLPKDTFFAGAINATTSMQKCLMEGQKAGAKASGLDTVTVVPKIIEPTILPMESYWQTPYTKGAFRSPKQFIDYQNDTCVADVKQAILEGFESIEHIKRYTALGFGTDQGKIGNINGMAVAAEAMNQAIEKVGTTTFRPAYTPVTFGALAGRSTGKFFEPIRTTAMHSWHLEQGAQFEPVGQWLRPWYYPLNGETLEDAVARESLAVRSGVGMLDVSTLGKIEVKGRDAAKFVNTMYSNPFLKLEIGKARYGLMLGEDGMVIDDGVALRLADNHYYLHTTTNGAASIFNWMERWAQTEWPEMEVFLTSVTDHWSTIAVVGPKSRLVLEKVCNDINFKNEEFPFMTFKEGNIKGLFVRICRISFSGELAYEVNVNANYGRQMWEWIYAAGKEENITAYGTETMHVLRAEKGYIIVGQDTDGSVTPFDLGMGWCVGKKKTFIGDRSLKRQDMFRKDRKQLVGLRSKEKDQRIPEGAQLVNSPNFSIPAAMQGHVTSSYFSYALGYSIALALVKGGLNRLGETIYSPQPDGSVIEALIVSPIFYDEKGEKRDG